ncbi:MAG: HAD family hydrolase [Thermoprotei archaeon]
MDAAKISALKGVIFDMDGTLLDSREAFIRQIEDFFVINGLQKPSPDITQKLLGRSYVEIFKEAFGKTDPDFIKESLLWMNYSYRYFYVNKYAKLIPGSFQCVSSLVKGGFRVGIATNAPRIVLDYFMKHYGFNQLRIISISGDDVPEKKPKPDMLIRLQDKLGLESTELIYVGDMDLDIEAAHSAGILSAAVLTGLSNYEEITKARPDIILPSANWVCRLLRT